MEPAAIREGARPRHPPDGMTALHLAVLNDDHDQVRALIYSHRRRVNEPTSTGATPLMLAGLFGRAAIFMYLLRKTARLHRRDRQGLTACEYARRVPFARNLARRYAGIARARPSRAGRKAILRVLRQCAPEAAKSRMDAAARRSAEPDAPSGHPGAEEAHASEEGSATRIVSLRKGGVFEISEVRSLALVEVDGTVGRKTCGGIRAQGEKQYRAVAMSGWAGAQSRRVVDSHFLNNAEYHRRTRAVGALFGHRFNNSISDCTYKGTRAERNGAWHASHIEKQLAVFVIRDHLAQVLGIQDITVENVAELKSVVQEKGIQKDFIIELTHDPCDCCIRFLELMGRKTGLRFKWLSREWFSEGVRPRLKMWEGRPVRASQNDPDGFEDELDADDEEYMRPGAAEATTLEDQETECAVPDIASVGNNTRSIQDARPSQPKPAASLGSRAKHQLKRTDPIPRKEGSAVPEHAWPPGSAHQNETRRLVLKKRKAGGRRPKAATLAAGRATDTATAPSSQASSQSSEVHVGGAPTSPSPEVAVRTVGVSSSPSQRVPTQAESMPSSRPEAAAAAAGTPSSSPSDARTKSLPFPNVSVFMSEWENKTRQRTNRGSKSFPA